MADSHAETAHDHVHGEMEISAQNQMFELFIKMAKWGTLAIAVTVVFLTVWFAVGAGFIAALVSSVVLAVAGVFALKSKPAEAH